MRKIIFLSAFLFLAMDFCFAEESITITTYYPSPYGSYNELQLYPHSFPATSCGSTTRGTMYYDSDEDEVKTCDGSDWQSLSGIPAGAVMFFNLSSCPAGWSELTSARGRYLVGLPSGGTLGAAVGTALSNSENRAVGSHSHNVTITSWLTSTIAASGCTPLVTGCPGHYAHALRIDTGNPLTGTTDIAGSVAGTNSPYIQLLVCQKD